MALQRPQDLDPKERKRQFAALGRRLEKPCPPGVLAKWEAATTDEAKSPICKYQANAEFHQSLDPTMNVKKTKGLWSLSIQGLNF